MEVGAILDECRAPLEVELEVLQALQRAQAHTEVPKVWERRAPGGSGLAESGRTLQGSFSAGWLAGKPDYPQKLKVPAVLKPNFANKYAAKSIFQQSTIFDDIRALWHRSKLMFFKFLRDLQNFCESSEIFKDVAEFP